MACNVLMASLVVGALALGGGIDDGLDAPRDLSSNSQPYVEVSASDLGQSIVNDDAAYESACGGQPAEEGTGQPVDEGAKPLAEESTNSPVDEGTNQPVEKSANQPTDAGANLLAGEVAERPGGEGTGHPGDGGVNPPEEEGTNPPSVGRTNPPSVGRTNPPDHGGEDLPAGGSTNPPTGEPTTPPVAGKAKSPALKSGSGASTWHYDDWISCYEEFVDGTFGFGTAYRGFTATGKYVYYIESADGTLGILFILEPDEIQFDSYLGSVVHQSDNRIIITDSFEDDKSVQIEVDYIDVDGTTYVELEGMGLATLTPCDPQDAINEMDNALDNVDHPPFW